MPIPPLSSLKECLLDLTQPVAKRNHAAFFLRTMNSEEAMSVIAEALAQKSDSALMRHELSYILGQMQKPSVCPLLIQILEDDDDDVLVRHESAEALGAIGDECALPVLQKFSNHSAPEISETCQIAVDLILWKKSGGEKLRKSEYLSIDPAPPFDDSVEGNVSSETLVERYRSILVNPSETLFNRYRAMFSLRNMNCDAAALALLDGFSDDSALFRHEIAYVLGQVQRLVTVEGLSTVLRNTSEHRMVRHEAAEALGAIGGKAAEAVLQDFQQDVEPVVHESCLVALDTMDYWGCFADGDAPR